MRSTPLRRAVLAALLVASVLLVAGCAPIQGGGQPVTPPSGGLTLSEGVRLGQSLTARHSGLTAVEVHLGPALPGGGEVTLSLRAGPRDAREVARAVIPVSSVTSPGFYRFTFAPQNMPSRDAYFELSVAGGSSVAVATAPGATYLHGALYANGEAQDRQMAFRLVYDPMAAAGGLAREAAGWLGLLLAAAVLFVLPGWALLAGKGDWWDAIPWPARIGLAAGLGMAIYPVVMLATGLAGIKAGPAQAWLPPLLAGAWTVWQGRRRPPEAFAAARSWVHSGSLWPDLAFLALAALVTGVRWYAARGLPVPMWGDSFQHAVIVQLMLDNGGLFSSWHPYAELQSLTYHFGFHAETAALAWMTGLDAPAATLWLGQVLNVLAVLALYPLAWKLGGSRWAGAAAVLVAGMLSPMPMVYLNWGRYTQLAGQVVLPALAFLCWERLDARGPGRRMLPLIWLALGGLALIHYRILIFAVAFLVCLVVVGLMLGRGRAAVRDFILFGLGGGAIFLPWFLHLYGGKILGNLAAKMATGPAQVNEFQAEYNALGDLATYLPAGVWVALLLCLGWGLWRRSHGTALLALWSGLMLAVANPGPLGLPGTAAVNNFTVLIAAYIPAAVLIGGAAGWLVQRATTPGQGRDGAGRWAPAAMVLLLLAAGVWGTPQRLADVRVAESSLATDADLRAAAWIRVDTPADARFLVNAFSAFGGGTVVGSDGGWWLPLLAQRQSTLPPINYVTEQGPRPDYVQWVNALPEAVLAKGPTHPDVLAMLRERGVTHVYIGQQHGRANYGGPVIEPAALLADAHFRTVYHEDRVWVFQIVQ